MYRGNPSASFSPGILPFSEATPLATSRWSVRQVRASPAPQDGMGGRMERVVNPWPHGGQPESRGGTCQNDPKPQGDPQLSRTVLVSSRTTWKCRETSAIQSQRDNDVTQVTCVDPGLGNTRAHPGLSSMSVHLPPQLRQNSLRKKKVRFAPPLGAGRPSRLVPSRTLPDCCSLLMSLHLGCRR